MAMDQEQSVLSRRATWCVSGSHVMDATGEVVVIDMVHEDGTVLGRGAWDRLPRVVRVVGDAWGGEHDQQAGLLAA